MSSRPPIRSEWVAPEWIAVDWGTSHLRAFAMQGGEVLAAAASSDGMGGLTPEAFEPALLALIGPWLGGAGEAPTEVRAGAPFVGGEPANAPLVPGTESGAPMLVFACGMVGAKQGWHEAPYRTVPCAPVAVDSTVTVPCRDPRLRVEIVPGLSALEPADVMRGEETQIAGFLSLEPEFHGLVLLPGTHSKHVTIADGQVQAFRTLMTGELFALLSQRSVLRHTVATGGWSQTAFDEGVSRGLRGLALQSLFALRAESLVDSLSAQEARARLSGLLIGAEIAEIASGSDVVLIGDPELSSLYAEALRLAGIKPRVVDGGDLVRLGLTRLWKGSLNRP